MDTRQSLILASMTAGTRSPQLLFFSLSPICGQNLRKTTLGSKEGLTWFW